MIRAALALLVLCFLVAGCGGKPAPEVRIVTQRVEVPIAVPCKVDRGAQPSYAAETVPLTSEIFALVQALLVEREQRKAREAELNGALDRCG